MSNDNLLQHDNRIEFSEFQSGNKPSLILSGKSQRSENYSQLFSFLQSPLLPLPLCLALLGLVEFLNLMGNAFTFFQAKNKNLDKTLNLAVSTVVILVGATASAAFCFSLLPPLVVGGLFLAVVGIDTLYKLGQFFYHLFRYFSASSTENNNKAFFSYLSQKYGIASLDGLLWSVGIAAMIVLPLFFASPIALTTALVIIACCVAEMLLFSGVLASYRKQTAASEKIQFVKQRLLMPFFIGVLIAAITFLPVLIALVVKFSVVVLTLCILNKLEEKYPSSKETIEISVQKNDLNPMNEPVITSANTLKNDTGFDYYFSKNRVKKLSDDAEKNREFLQTETIAKIDSLYKQIRNNLGSVSFLSEKNKRQEKYDFLIKLLVSQLPVDKEIAESIVTNLVSPYPQKETYKQAILAEHEKINQKLTIKNTHYWKKIHFENFDKEYVEGKTKKAFQSFFKSIGDIEDIYVAVRTSFPKQPSPG